MAEKYGTIPQKFTKDWWEWYWTYHKGLIIGIVILIIFISIGVTDYLSTEKFDLTLTYSGQAYYDSVVQAKVEEAISPLCDDLDGNGEKSLYFSILDIDLNSTDSEYLQAQSMRLGMSFGEDESYIFILDKSIADIYFGASEDACVFAPLEDWVTEDISGFETISAHGKAYGIDISGLEIFKDTGFDTEGKYLFMRYYPSENQIKKHLKGYNGATILANRILSAQ